MAGPRLKVQINGSLFHIKKFDVFTGLRLLGDLQRRFLGPMSQIIQAAQQAAQTENQEVDPALIREGIAKVSATIDGETLVILSKKLLDPECIAVEIDGGPAEKLTENMLNRATEDVADVLALLTAVIQENYSNVFTLAWLRTGLGRPIEDSQLGFLDKT